MTNDWHLWTYASAEYDVEAYQVEIQDPSSVKTRMQMSDCRILLGASTQRGAITGFIEGGGVFDRHVRFRGPVTDFGINDCLIMRMGILY
jgi:hypothetical protein